VAGTTTGAAKLKAARRVKEKMRRSRSGADLSIRLNYQAEVLKQAGLAGKLLEVPPLCVTTSTIH